MWYEKAAAQGWASSINNLALFYATNTDPARRDPLRALSYWRKLEGETEEATLLDTKACVLAANGDLEEAIATLQRALDVLAADPKWDATEKASLQAEFQTHLASFRDGNPFIEP
jgi:Flp pilus assembly protein TadD